MGNIFHTVLFQPIFNLLVFLYNVLPGADVGFAIIALTILIKLALWPLMHTSLKSQKALQEIQPKIEELKVQYKGDREGLSKAMMGLYQTEKVNPLSSCLPILVQLPVLIALYQVLFKGFGGDTLTHLYSFIHNPGHINTMFLGFIDLTKPYLFLALLSGIFQYFQTRMLISKQPPKLVRGTEGAKDESMLASMNKTMLYFMPIMTVVIGATLPGGLTLYWVTVNIFSIIQQKMAFSQHEKATIGTQKQIEGSKEQKK